ncbi:MAG: PorP/SprF family type IX secretion system membrane protein [Bacteroidales bacterium]|nr:PorP/SprF family type IX secretion system membrane protein [Bacteroidales bacterium]
MKKIVLYGLLLLSSLKISAQDIHFTQFHASPLYLNPAMAGANSDSRLSMIYRNQWWNIPGTFNSFLASYDQYFDDFRSAVGIILASDNAGSMNFGNKFIGIDYAYDYKFSREWTVSSGLKAVYGYRSLQFDKLIFGDQLIRGASSSIQPVLPEKQSYLDLSFGTLLYSAYHYVGITLDHLNRPNQSYLGYDSRLPIKFSLHAAKTFFIYDNPGYGKKSDKPVLIGLFQYKFQGKFDQTDMGLVYKTPLYFAGIYYRGIPLLKYYKKGYPNNDAICLLAGISYKNIEVAYSYDATISWQTYRTGGSNEISVIYQFYNPQKPKKHRAKIIPCAKF